MLLRENECRPINHEWLLNVISDGNSSQFVVDSTQTWQHGHIWETGNTHKSHIYHPYTELRPRKLLLHKLLFYSSWCWGKQRFKRQYLGPWPTGQQNGAEEETEPPHWSLKSQPNLDIPISFSDFVCEINRSHKVGTRILRFSYMKFSHESYLQLRSIRLFLLYF